MKKMRTRKLSSVDRTGFLVLDWARRKTDRWERVLRLMDMRAPPVIMQHARRMAKEATRCHAIAKGAYTPLWLKKILIHLVRFTHRTPRENATLLIGSVLDKLLGNGIGYVKAYSIAFVLNEMRKHIAIYLGEDREDEALQLLDRASIMALEEFIWSSSWERLKDEVDKMIRRKKKCSASKTTSHTSKRASTGRRKAHSSQQDSRVSRSKTRKGKTGRKS